jgi:ferredoxin
MRFHVNDSCIGCGLCVSTCPEVFRMTDENVAAAAEEETAADAEAAALEAEANCPASAIETVKE